MKNDEVPEDLPFNFDLDEMKKAMESGSSTITDSIEDFEAF